jgi:hypothetical protein
MKTALALTALFLIMVSPAAAATVTVDFDQDTDFSSFKTFQFIDTKDSSFKTSDPLMHKKIVDLLVARLTAAGMEEVDADPDLYVTYHGKSREGNKFTSASYGYNTWDGAYVSWGGEVHTGSQFVYEEGTLIVDAWSAKGNNLVFRGVSTQIFKNTADKRVKQMEQALVNMSKKFKKLRAGKKN